MALSPGTRLGPYEVLAAIGAGGMGEVYKARDTRLERIVALKVLPAALAADAEFKARFEREAKSISALNHPHICTLYDVGSQNGTDFLVMELVEGETIAARLARAAPTGLDLDEVLTYGMQIADALDRAHRQGIVHRDLKPGNIIITKSGIKLLDFGLAKMLPDAGAGAVSMPPTALADLTMQGTIVGTLQYMAPEQVEARETDARADIFAFGAVLYEMATGEKAFAGRSQASVIAAILDREPPPISSRRSLAPPELDRVVATCLAKDPDDRWQSTRDLSRALRWIASGAQQARDAPHGSARSASRFGWWLAAAGLVLGALAGAAVTWQWVRPAPAAVRGETRFSIELPFTHRSAAWTVAQAAISADGERIVYQAGRYPDRVLYLRSLADPTGRKIEGTEGAQNPFFSPDGRSVGFFADGELKKVNLLGGRAVRVCDAPDISYGASWFGDTIVFSTNVGLAIVPASGGTTRVLTTTSDQKRRGGHRSPVFVPGGAFVLFVAVSGGDLPGAIEAVEVGSGRRQVLVADLRPESRGVQYLSSGHLLYEQNQSLLAQPFDLAALKVTGPAVPIHQGVATLGSTLSQFAVSASGTLVYVPHTEIPDEILTWVARDGTESPLSLPAGRYHTPRISPDGSGIAVVGDRGSAAPIILANLATGALGELPRQKGTFGPAPVPAWTPDGASVTYSGANQRDVMIQPVDRTSGERVLFTTSTMGSEGAWTRTNGREVLALTLDPGDVWVWSSAQGKVAPWIQTAFFEGNPVLSPDGRWIAYTSTQTRVPEIWVQPLTEKGKPVQVSVGGGTFPAWGRDGREVFYLDRDTMMAATVKTTPTFSAEPPRRLLDVAAYNLEGRSRNYDVDPKSGRFLMTKTVGGPAPRAQLVVVVDWLAGALARIKS